MDFWNECAPIFGFTHTPVWEGGGRKKVVKFKLPLSSTYLDYFSKYANIDSQNTYSLQHMYTK